MPHTETTVRQCLVSGEHLPTRDMIRFVVGPDETIVPDLEERLPGRGLWVTAKRDMIETAAAKRGFARAAKAAVTVPDQLAEKVAGLLKRRCLDRLGLARRAGLAVCGGDQVKAALNAAQVAVLVEASDGSAGERGKFEAMARGLAVVDAFDRRALGEVLGRDEVVHIGLKPGALSTAFVHDTARYVGVRGGPRADGGMPGTA